MNDPQRPAPLFVTPDAVAVDLDVATVGSRAAAFVLDLLLLGTAALLIVLAGSFFFLQGLADVVTTSGWLGTALILLLLFALLFGYPIAFETLRRGRTPGKAALGLRVVTVEGAPVALRHSAIRSVFAVIELYALLGAPAVLASLLTRRAQRLGDLTAGTMVVRERRAASRPVAERFLPPRGLEQYTGQLDVSGLGAADYVTVRDTLRRAPDLPEPARTEVLTGLARSLLGRVQPAPPAGVDPQLFLRCVAAAVQRRSATTHPVVGAPGPTPSAGPMPTGGPTGPQGSVPDAAAPTRSGWAPASPPPPRAPADDGFAPPS